MSKPLFVGITGGIGSGKSIVCRVFNALGIPVYLADDRAKSIINTNPDLVAAIKDRFGPSVYGPDGLIDRKQLAALVFGPGNEANLHALNNMVHPIVALDTLRWVEANSGAPYLIKEAAILFESGAYRAVHYSVLVTAPFELKLARVMARDGAARHEIEARMANQWSDEKKTELADFVIVNDEKTPLLPQVLQLHQRFLEHAHSVGPANS